MIEVIRADLSNPRHAEALIELLNGYASDPMGGSNALPDPVRRNLVPALRERPGIQVLLAFAGENAVGLLICMEGFSTFACKPLMNIHDLVVAPGYRGKGISTLLLQACETLALENGCCKMTLEVLQGNKVARAAYARFGFAPYELSPETGKAMFWEKKL